MGLSIARSCALSLIISRVYASLPYSVPELDGHHFQVREETSRLDSPPSPFPYVTTGHSGSFLQTGTSSYLSTGISTLIRVSSTAPSETAGTIPSTPSSSVRTDQAPFPIPSNSTSTIRISSISGGSFPSDTTSKSPRLSARVSSTYLSVTSSSFSATISSDSTVVDNTPIVVTTVIVSSGAPHTIIITTTASNIATTRSDETVVETVQPSSTLNPINSIPSHSGGPDLSLQSPTPTSSMPTLAVPPPHVFDAVIDDAVYHLPSPNVPPVDILLLDGSTARLFSNRVVLRGQTLEVPSDLSSTQEISVGGQTVKAQPGQSDLPPGYDGDDHGGGGGGGLFGALGSLVGAAGKAVGGMANAGKGAVDLAAGGAGAVAGGLGGTLSTAAKDLGGVVSGLNGIQKSLPFDQLANVAGGALGTVLGAQNLGRDAVNWLTSMGKMVQGFDNLKPEVQQQVRDNMREYAKKGGPLEAAEQAIQAFEDFPWESQIPTSLPLSTGAPSATQASSILPSKGTESLQATTGPSTTDPTSTTATSSTTSSAVAETPLTYYIQTETGTSLETFQNFIQKLDGGSGRALSNELVDYQIYTTQLLPSQADELRRNKDLVYTIFASVFDPAHLEADDNFNAPSTSLLPRLEERYSQLDANNSMPQPKARKHPRKILPPHENAPYWKKMVSSPPLTQPRSPQEDPPYVTDDSGGKGTTVYIIDEGFDIDIPDLSPGSRTVRHFFVSNTDAFPANFLVGVRQLHPLSSILPETIQSPGEGHGTKMASIAAGRYYGIAPNADLYLLKAKGVWKKKSWVDSSDHSKGQRESDHTYAYQPNAMGAVLFEIKMDITDRKLRDPESKSVINMSLGIRLAGDLGQQMEPVFAKFFLWATQAGVTIVAAAGNDPTISLHEQVPTKFGTATNNIITVGGVTEDGTLYESTTPHEAGQAGSMSVFAPAVNVNAPGNGGLMHLGTGLNTGTSQAAAITSGLAAYLYSLPGANYMHHPGVPLPHDDMKQFIISHAWTRVPKTDFSRLPPGWPELDSLDVVYNLARGDPAHEGDPCAVPFRKRANKRTDDPAIACSATPTASISTFVTSIGSSRVSSASAVPLSSTIEPSVLSSANPSGTRSLPPSPTNESSSAVPTKNPTTQVCRLLVVEFDNPDQTNHSNETWRVSVAHAEGTPMQREVPFCLHGGTFFERWGLDLSCPHLGKAPWDSFNVRRDDDDTLRIIWGDKSWRETDERCKVAKPWGPSDGAAKEKRQRKTQCDFECTIDESLPPAYRIGFED